MKEELMQARELMTAEPVCCTPKDSIEAVARMMVAHDCGCVPVVESRHSNRLVGIVTDRDLVIRGLAQGKSGSTKVREVMTENPFSCEPDDDVSAIERTMADRQVRRVPIVNADGGCVGVVAQADLACAALDGGRLSDREVAMVVEHVSEPSRGWDAPSLERQV
jgi:CBS domain-containing protein